MTDFIQGWLRTSENTYIQLSDISYVIENDDNSIKKDYPLYIRLKSNNNILYLDKTESENFKKAMKQVSDSCLIRIFDGKETKS